jgi:UDP-galactopyranose mutase
MTVLVVGAGLAGAVVAERLTAHDISVVVVDQADHIGGTAHDYVNEHGLRVHACGPHAFHTRSRAVFEYLSRFTTWRPYEHRVMNRVGQQLVPMPISRATLNALFGLSLQTESETAAWYEAHRDHSITQPRTSKDLVVSRVGQELYDLLYREYTRKQWGRGGGELDATVAGRLPFRTNDDDRYFTDPFQAMPIDGFTALFERMLADVDVRLGQRAWPGLSREFEHTVWTGRPDEFFGYTAGRLKFRSMRFVEQSYKTGGALVQPCATVNEMSPDLPHTRTTEYRWMTGEASRMTTVQLEYPSDEGEPHYPVLCPETRATMASYRRLVQDRPDVTFVGRLARFQYMTMDQVTAQALKISRDLLGQLAPAAAV